MPLYRFTWDDGRVTVRLAEDEEEMRLALAECNATDDQIDPKMIHEITSFAVDFLQPVREDAGWDVEPDGDTEDLLFEAAGEVEAEIEDDNELKFD